ncbi:MAG: hypothetical protein EZS28_003517 [Streblomastix strix]|uniref:Uncharacterized protein n=1 Tax=Streblomastix strix TaxID=222440 RepID=A0A5J4X116_9EUKA|nr:MAG: hypothetical protein EZS28_003517 [Streblomastix strix]
MDELIQTIERASEETRLEIRRRVQMVSILTHEDKAKKAFACDKVSQIEQELQNFAIRAQMMIKAAKVSLIAGNALKRREVAVIPSCAKEALLTGDGIILQLDSESKATIAEELKSLMQISTQLTTCFQPIADDKRNKYNNSKCHS